MTRKLLWLLLGGALASGATLVATGGSSKDNSAQSDQVAALAAELAEVKAGLHGVEGSLNRAGARAAAAATQLALAARPGGPSVAAPAPPLDQSLEAIPPEEQARIEREHHGKLDLLARSGGGASAPTALLRSNLDAVIAKQGKRIPGLSVDDLSCSASLCRVAMRIPVANRGSALRELYATLTNGMSEMTMRPFQGDQAVFYLAPAGHQLPSPN